MNRDFFKIAGILLWQISFNINTSYASHIAIADDGADIIATISAKEINRIKVIGDKIRSVKKSQGNFTISHDAILGDIYLKTTNNPNSKPLNLFIITQKGFTYKLLLLLKNIPSEQVFIKNDSIGQDVVIKDHHEQEIVNLYKSMANSELLDGYKIIHDKSKFRNKGKINLQLQSSYKGQSLVGQIYKIFNDDDINLHEKMFHDKGVRAIALQDKETLFVIKQVEKDNEE